MPQPRPRTIKVASINCRSLISPEKLASLLAGCEAQEIGILLCQETWLGAEQHPRIPSDWQHLMLPRPAHKPAGRGASIFVYKPQVQARGWTVQQVQASSPEAYDLLAARIGPWLMATVYVAPSSAPDYGAVVDALAALRRGPEDNVLVGGDFNGGGRHGVLNQGMEEVLGLQPLVRPPLVTRLAPDRLLDNIYAPADTGAQLDMVDAFDPHSDFSDHLAVIATLPQPGQPAPQAGPPPPPPTPTRQIRWKQLDLWQRLAVKGEGQVKDDATAKLEHFQKRVQAIECEDLQEVNDAFLQICQEELGTYRPRQGRRHPYLSHPEARAALKRRQQARKAFNRAIRRGHGADGQAPHAQAALNQADREWRAARDEAIGRTTEDLLSRVAAGGTDAFFRRYRSARGARRSTREAEAYLDPTQTAAFWQEIFTSRAGDVREREPYTDEVVIITSGQVIEAINRMTRKAPGPDGLDFRFLRACRDEVAGVLARSFTKALAEGLSGGMRGATTILTGKEGADRRDPGGYRPITLLPMVVRLLHVVLDRLFRPALLEATAPRRQPSIGRTQAAFRAKRNTYEQAMMLQMVQAIHKEAVGVRKMLLGAFLDIKKAYDSMEYEDLLDILEHTHLFPRAWLEILRKLLPGNETTIMGVTVYLLRGLPQGGALCPLLCNAYMEELARELAEYILAHPTLGRLWREGLGSRGHLWGLDTVEDLWLRLLQFADDIALLAATPEEMQQLLDVVAAWARRRHLDFSPKSIAVLLSKPKGPEPQLPPLHVGDVPLQWHPSREPFRYLGVTTQAATSHRRLGGGTTAQYKEGKARAAISGLYQMFQVRRRQYYVVPQALRLGIEQVIYAAALYDTALVDINYKSLDRMTLRAVRNILQVPPTTPTAFLRWELRLWPSHLRAAKRAVGWARHCWHESWIGKEILQHYLLNNVHRERADELHPFFTMGPLGRLSRLLEQVGFSWQQIHAQDPKALKTQRATAGRLETAFVKWLRNKLQSTASIPSRHREEMLDLLGLGEGKPVCWDLPLYLYIGGDLPRAGIWARMPYLRYQCRGARVPRAPCAWCGRPESEYGHHLLRCPHMPPRLLRRRDSVLAAILAEVRDASHVPVREEPQDPVNLERLYQLQWRGSANWKKTPPAASYARADKGHQPTKETLTAALWFFRDMINTYRRATAGTGAGGSNPVWELPTYEKATDVYRDPSPGGPADNEPLPRPPPPPPQVGDSLANLPPPSPADDDMAFGFSPDPPSL